VSSENLCTYLPCVRARTVVGHQNRIEPGSAGSRGKWMRRWCPVPEIRACFVVIKMGRWQGGPSALKNSQLIRPWPDEKIHVFRGQDTMLENGDNFRGCVSEPKLGCGPEGGARRSPRLPDLRRRPRVWHGRANQAILEDRTVRRLASNIL
jgi:hypothetical protein